MFHRKVNAVIHGVWFWCKKRERVSLRLKPCSQFFNDCIIYNVQWFNDPMNWYRIKGKFSWLATGITLESRYSVSHLKGTWCFFSMLVDHKLWTDLNNLWSISERFFILAAFYSMLLLNHFSIWYLSIWYSCVEYPY